ncbi:unnamed protein product [Amoebophrya sp. A25]|nr:unnamed protein product [Amoebophrya sp. A25]|eukprot:GSA25T00021801001.1
MDSVRPGDTEDPLLHLQFLQRERPDSQGSRPHTSSTSVSSDNTAKDLARQAGALKKAERLERKHTKALMVEQGLLDPEEALRETLSDEEYSHHLDERTGMWYRVDTDEEDLMAIGKRRSWVFDRHGAQEFRGKLRWAREFIPVRGTDALVLGLGQRNFQLGEIVHRGVPAEELHPSGRPLVKIQKSIMHEGEEFYPTIGPPSPLLDKIGNPKQTFWSRKLKEYEAEILTEVENIRKVIEKEKVPFILKRERREKLKTRVQNRLKFMKSMGKMLGSTLDEQVNDLIAKAQSSAMVDTGELADGEASPQGKRGSIMRMGCLQEMIAQNRAARGEVSPMGTRSPFGVRGMMGALKEQIKKEEEEEESKRKEFLAKQEAKEKELQRIHDGVEEKGFGDVGKKEGEQVDGDGQQAGQQAGGGDPSAATAFNPDDPLAEFEDPEEKEKRLELQRQQEEATRIQKLREEGLLEGADELTDSQILLAKNMVGEKADEDDDEQMPVQATLTAEDLSLDDKMTILQRAGVVAPEDNPLAEFLASVPDEFQLDSHSASSGAISREVTTGSDPNNPNVAGTSRLDDATAFGGTNLDRMQSAEPDALVVEDVPSSPVRAGPQGVTLPPLSPQRGGSSSSLLSGSQQGEDGAANNATNLVGSSSPSPIRARGTAINNSPAKKASLTRADEKKMESMLENLNKKLDQHGLVIPDDVDNMDTFDPTPLPTVGDSLEYFPAGSTEGSGDVALTQMTDPSVQKLSLRERLISRMNQVRKSYSVKRGIFGSTVKEVFGEEQDAYIQPEKKTRIIKMRAVNEKILATAELERVMASYQVETPWFKLEDSVRMADIGGAALVVIRRKEYFQRWDTELDGHIDRVIAEAEAAAEEAKRARSERAMTKKQIEAQKKKEAKEAKLAALNAGKKKKGKNKGDQAASDMATSSPSPSPNHSPPATPRGVRFLPPASPDGTGAKLSPRALSSQQLHPSHLCEMAVRGQYSSTTNVAEGADQPPWVSHQWFKWDPNAAKKKKDKKKDAKEDKKKDKKKDKKGDKDKKSLKGK